MAEVVTTYHGKSVKDVPADDFINAFSAYLKSTGKVRVCLTVSRCYVNTDRFLWGCGDPRRDENCLASSFLPSFSTGIPTNIGRSFFAYACSDSADHADVLRRVV